MAEYYKRGAYQVKQICKFADNRGFSDVVVINENRKKARSTPRPSPQLLCPHRRDALDLSPVTRPSSPLPSACGAA